MLIVIEESVLIALVGFAVIRYGINVYNNSKLQKPETNVYDLDNVFDIDAQLINDSKKTNLVLDTKDTKIVFSKVK